VIVLCVRPPLNTNDGWQAHFRQRDKETAWIYGKPQPTLEEAMMSVIGKLETLLDSRLISHASLGRSVLPGEKRFCTLESPDHENYSAKADTLEEASEAAYMEGVPVLMRLYHTSPYDVEWEVPEWCIK